jgi:hypothetical protein
MPLKFHPQTYNFSMNIKKCFTKYVSQSWIEIYTKFKYKLLINSTNCFKISYKKTKKLNKIYLQIKLKMMS